MKPLFISVILFTCSLPIYSQWTPDILLTRPQLKEEDGDKFSIEADITGFFKNNEYFSPIVKGETLPGVHIKPYAAYQWETTLRAEIGMTGLYYSGDQHKDGTYLFNGIFAKLQYAINPDLNLILGNHYGGVNHRLIEPIYGWEGQLKEKPESGIQLIYEDKKYFADVWLNWQRFIQKGDSVPEVLTFGSSLSMRITKPDNRLTVSIPLQLVIFHQGGQIDVSEEKMIVSGNLVTGICSSYAIEKSFVKSVGMNLYIAGYYDKLPDDSKRPYKNGWGIYPILSVDASPFRFMAGYWYARHFYSFEGEPLFGSFNTDYPDKALPQRRLITTKFSFSKQVHEVFAIGGQLETYSDLKRKKTDYSFGFHMRFTPQLFTK